jgi:hypothetical protein
MQKTENAKKRKMQSAAGVTSLGALSQKANKALLSDKFSAAL